MSVYRLDASAAGAAELEAVSVGILPERLITIANDTVEVLVRTSYYRRLKAAVRRQSELNGSL